MLTQHQFDRAKSFIQHSARPLDRAWFEFEFGDVNQNQVIDLLKEYQNKDGGFGHNLEPDIRLQSSSVIATTVALQYINHLELPSNHNLISTALDYLQEQFHQTKKITYFPKVPMNIDEQPHAPWWVASIGSPELIRWPNPNAEITGYFCGWSGHVDDKIRKDCIITLEQYLDEFEDSIKFDAYQFLCWKRALPHLSPLLQDRVSQMILKQVSEDDLNSEVLGHIKPQWLVTETTSILFEHFPDQIHNLLEEEVCTQADDGGWHPTWQWGDMKLWDQIDLEWAGKITAELLITLKYCNLLNL
jgi:hypothetical protein